MAFSTNDLRNGMTLDLPEGLFTVVEFQHVKPGKGGAFVRTKLRNARTKAVIERTFRAGEPLEQAVIDKREMQYLTGTARSTSSWTTSRTTRST